MTAQQLWVYNTINNSCNSNHIFVTNNEQLEFANWRLRQKLYSFISYLISFPRKSACLSTHH